jgi:hypothetical protein
MSYELLITAEAREDMAAGYHHYETQLAGLGERFYLPCFSGCQTWKATRNITATLLPYHQVFGM